MRRPSHEPAARLLQVHDVQGQVKFEPTNTRRRYNTTPAQLITKSTMQTIKHVNMKKLPSNAFHHHQLHTCKRLATKSILLTLSLALVVFTIAFASRFTTISAAATTTNRHHNHNHEHHHQQHQPPDNQLEQSSYRHSGNHRRPRHLNDENGRRGYESESSRHKSRPHRVQHMQEQQRLRNLIAKTSSHLRLPGAQHYKRAAARRAHDESPLQQPAESVAVQNLHRRRRRYRFYDNEIQYPKASRHFTRAPNLDVRLKTMPDQTLHGFSMHDDFKFWDDLEHDQYGDELDDIDSLDVDLNDDDDDDDDNDDDGEDDDDENLDEDEDLGADEFGVSNRIDSDEENSDTKYPRKGFGPHHNERHSKTSYSVKHPGYRKRELSPMIARAHENHSELHARNQRVLSDYNRHHVHGQPIREATEQHGRVSQVPYQSPVVVSISDNSFVSASPPVLVGSDTSRQQQHNQNAIDAMATDDELDSDGPTTTNNLTTSTTATTTSMNAGSLERDHVISSSGSIGIVSLFNMTGYNRVETSTRGNLFISDHDDGVSRNRKVHLLKPPAGGDTFNYLLDNSIRYSSRTATQLPIEDGVYTTHTDQISSHQKEDDFQKSPIANTYVPSPMVAEDHATYGYDPEFTATITSTVPSPSNEVAYKLLDNKIGGNDERPVSTNDDNIDDQDNDDDGDDKDDAGDDDIDLDEDDDNNLTIESVRIHPKSMENNPPPVRYSHIIASPNNELISDHMKPSYDQKYLHTAHHKATIQLVQEKPNRLRRGGINSAIIAILFGIGATGMLIMIVSIKMGSIRERVAYKGRRRSLVPDTDFLINTIPI